MRKVINRINSVFVTGSRMWMCYFILYMTGSLNVGFLDSGSSFNLKVCPYCKFETYLVIILLGVITDIC